MKSGAVRILVADDHPIFRDGLKQLLDAQPEFQVAGQASHGLEVLQLVDQLRPEVLLLDLSMEGLSGLDVLKRMPIDSAVRTILLTASIGPEDIVTALQLGARGIVLKESATTLLFKAIRCVMLGQYWLTHECVADMVRAMRRATAPITARETPASPFGLTRREREVVLGVAAGESNKEIARRLSIREHTVKHHLSSIFDKVGVYSRLELAVFAINHGLTGGEELHT